LTILISDPIKKLYHLEIVAMSLWSRLKPYRIRLLLLLSVIGPGIITANVDNDAGGITTYSVAGANYGYALLWMMPLVAIALIIVQEMSARLGVVTGKGLADLIRENMGVRMTTLLLGLLVFVNLANTVSEFAGVAASTEIFGISKFISVPLAAIGVWILVVKGSYKFVERIFLVASAIYLAYVASGIMAQPSWNEVAQAFVSPSFQLNAGYVTIFVTIIGTTIAPWMQFYQQSSIVDKGIRVSEYNYERVDVVIGSLFAVFVASFIMIACAATIYKNGLTIETAKDAALALGPLAGRYAAILFAVGLLNASLFSAAILPLSTSYSVCEAFGWESSISRRWKEAPVFFSIYTGFIVLGALIILLPIKSLIQAMLISQTLNGVLLPVILIAMLRLINNKGIMGKFTNSRSFNLLAWGTVIILIILAIILVILTFFPGIMG
jgi:NRAMP (natural resistance-associated macrophage protein)-like metal ion transporter